MLIGLQLYRADEHALRRQARAADALLSLPGIDAINLQFRNGDTFAYPNIDSAPVLERDSVEVTGAPGRRRPLTREIFDRLADAADHRGMARFAFINSDIVVTPAALDAIRDLDLDTYALSRCDVRYVDGQPRPGPIVTAGLDMFVIRVAWWRRNRRRFRDYILGEACWDNVYASILMCHSDGLVLNREPLILHEVHDTAWDDHSAAARYNGMLAALDSRYFSLWSHYWHRLDAARSAGQPVDEAALCRDAFTWRRSIPAALRQAVRSVRARYRFARSGTPGH